MYALHQHSGMVSWIIQVLNRGVRIAQFNLATPGGNTLEMQPLIAYVLPYNLKTKPI